MDLWYFLAELVMLLAGAFLLGTLAQRLRQSPIVGYLLAGTIIGPLLFNAEAVNQMAELGVALLLFSIGLEFSFKRLRQMGRMAIGGGTLQVLATLGLVLLITVKPLGLPQAFTLGAIVALSSTAVVMRVLVDRAEVDSLRGRACLAILLLQDIAIVPLVLTVNLLSPSAVETHIAVHILKTAAAALGLVFVLYLLLFRVAPVLLSVKGLFANRELIVLLSIAVGLGSAWSAHASGLSAALGAFIAGMLLGESPFAGQIRSDIGSLRILLVTLFFASVGMLAKPLWFITHAHWILLAAVLVFLLKAAVVFAVGLLFGLDRRYALATGITLGQIGEFSFVLAAAARQGGVLDPHMFDMVVSTIIVLMFTAPYMVSWASPLADRLIGLLALGRMGAPDQSAGQSQPRNRILVVGLGPAGRQVVQHLIHRQMEPVVIDVNPHSRGAAQKLGVEIHLGDATNPDILLDAGLDRFCMAVVTLPDPFSAVDVVAALKRLRPQLNIAARSRYSRHCKDLELAGARIVVDEETLVGHSLAHKIVDAAQEDAGIPLACHLAGKATEAPP